MAKIRKNYESINNSTYFKTIPTKEKLDNITQEIIQLTITRNKLINERIHTNELLRQERSKLVLMANKITNIDKEINKLLLNYN